MRFRRRRNPADDHLRVLERRFTETRSVQDEEAWAQAKIRVGVSTPEQEIGDAVIRRGNLLYDWEPHWEHPGALGLMPPYPWGHLFVLYATPYWSGGSGADVQLSSVSGLAISLPGFTLPPQLPVTQLAEIWRRRMTKLVVNVGAIGLARLSRECVCQHEDWTACPTHAVIFEDLVDIYADE